MSAPHGHGCFALQRDARKLFREALERCCVDHALAAKLHVGAEDAVALDGATLRMQGVQRILVIAMGKGAAAMLEAVLRREDIVRDREICGVLVAPKRPESLPDKVQFVRGAHPLPNEDSRHAADLILQTLQTEPAS